MTMLLLFAIVIAVALGAICAWDIRECALCYPGIERRIDEQSTDLDLELSGRISEIEGRYKNKREEVYCNFYAQDEIYRSKARLLIERLIELDDRAWVEEHFPEFASGDFRPLKRWVR